MRFCLLILFSLPFMVCSAQSEPNAELEFERFYNALKMDEIFNGLGGNVEVDTKQILADTLKDLPESQKQFLINAMGTAVLAEPSDMSAAKMAFKLKILSLLSPQELKIAADFYSTNIGLKAHRAIIEAEVAASNVLD
ncbi:hypothetical protein NQS96_07385 [Pseudoalteromonas shioyasakiensis]|uniref:hypothetical protein n=1 Tax=Pseudoalteromonas TaxID=53246 RepID=UPI000CF71FEE|nr:MULTISPECIES: hypothetical protein [Pseudoalteromonas]MCO6353309.1 hypothetical protein [Pseudoalteromonas shioyasakiensis]MCQ8881627.1 hypothetical protein [Pseudoalteromonas shioyasakiensis]|tara:strand:- start:233 stop:646 length:414 start_codon:yes stop_codon:yes gene_type:complete